MTGKTSNEKGCLSDFVSNKVDLAFGTEEILAMRYRLISQI
jgi:hypothetical protein